MIEPVNADLEPTALELLEQVVVQDVVVARNEVPGRPVGRADLHVAQQVDVVVACSRLDVVRQDERPVVSVRPERDHRDRAIRDPLHELEQKVVEIVQRSLDRPAWKRGPALDAAEPSTDEDLHGARDDRPDAVTAPPRSRTDAPLYLRPDEGRVALTPEHLDGLVGVEREEDVPVRVGPDGPDPCSRGVADRRRAVPLAPERIEPRLRAVVGQQRAEDGDRPESECAGEPPFSGLCGWDPEDRLTGLLRFDEAARVT